MIKAKLIVLGVERELLWTDIVYNKEINYKTGRPGELLEGGLINLTFMSGYNDDALMRWITYNEEEKLCTLAEGKVVFYEGDFDGVIAFQYKFNDAALIYWKETFDSQNDEPMTVSLTISAAIQEFKGVTHVKHWQENWTVPSIQEPHVAEEDFSKQVIEYYITDVEGNRIKDYYSEETIFLTIKTKNRIGDRITLYLDDKSHDFKYKGNILENDILDGIVLESDVHKVELEIIEEQAEA